MNLARRNALSGEKEDTRVRAGNVKTSIQISRTRIKWKNKIPFGMSIPRK